MLLNGVNALSLIFAVVFLKYRSEINMLQVLPDLYEENADQDVDNNVCVPDNGDELVRRLYIPISGVSLPMERIWSFLGFAAGRQCNLL